MKIDDSSTHYNAEQHRRRAKKLGPTALPPAMPMGSEGQQGGDRGKTTVRVKVDDIAFEIQRCSMGLAGVRPARFSRNPVEHHTFRLPIAKSAQQSRNRR